MGALIDATGYLKIVSNSQYQSQKILDSLKVFLKNVLFKDTSITRLEYSKEDEAILIAYISDCYTSSFENFMDLIISIQNIPLRDDKAEDAFQDLVTLEYTLQIKMTEIFANAVETKIDIVLYHPAYFPLDSIRVIANNTHVIHEEEL